jgi:glycosyltransferase involved in cell wall biosynthesis
MRVLFVLHQFFPEFSAGTERVGLNLARMAQRAGHTVHVLSCRMGEAPLGAKAVAVLPGAVETVIEGVRVTLMDRRTLPQQDSSLEPATALQTPLQGWLERGRFDLVHGMHTMRMSTVFSAVERLRLPLILSLTDHFLPCFRVNLVDLSGNPCEGPSGGHNCAQRCATPLWPLNALRARSAQAESLVRRARWCVAPSAYVARSYQKIYPGLEVKVIPHGVDLLKLMASRPETGLAETPLTLGFVGTLNPAKGLHILLSALATRPDWPLRLLIVGPSHDNAYAQQIHSAAQSDARVQFLGSLAHEEVHAVMRRLDLLCLPSVVPESFSLVVQEAAAVGVPALVSDLGAAAEHIARTGAGAVVSPGQVQAWTHALEAWVTQPALRATWRAAVRLPMRVEEEAFLYESLYLNVRASF